MKNILVAIDFSPVTDLVIEAAAEMALAFKGKVLLLNVAPREPDVFGVQLKRKVVEEPVPDDMRERFDGLNKRAEELRGKDVECETRLIHGDRVRTILEEAEQLDAYLVVMGSHGRSGLYRTLVGSVSEGVLKANRFPLLVVPSGVIENHRG